MKKEILLPVAVKREIIKTFKSDRFELRRALTFEVNSPRANVLRAAAIHEGGKLFTGKPTDEVLNNEEYN